MKASCALAGSIALALIGIGPARATTLRWTPGWDNFSEPLNSAASSVVYTLSASNKLTVTFTLAGATPSKAYQVAIILFNQCPTVLPMFGQFPQTADSGCTPYTRQGVSASTSNTELAVVTTDATGNGSTAVTVGPLSSGTYKAEFIARDGVGCVLSGGNVNACSADFQSPGPMFGTTVTITVP